MPQGERRLRADARRNRERVLEVAAKVFATEGLSVPVHEIARRAGVGTGTVTRHFPAKEDLYAAILLTRMQQLCREADQLSAREQPGDAFFAFFAVLVREGTRNRGLAEALAGAGYDLDELGARAGWDVSGWMRQLLVRAQRAGAVRTDIDYLDVKALMTACMARGGDAVVAVVRDGLSPR